MKLLIVLLQVCALNLFAQDDFSKKLSSAAIELTLQQVEYDPQYFSIKYPNGDVPSNKGVCTL